MANKRNYLRLSIEDFGRELLRTNDLDPIYVALVEAFRAGDYSREQLHRWMVAYWCFYHAGVASFLSEKPGEEFWHWFEIAARNEQEAPTGRRWPRGHERRHFRAKVALDTLEALRTRYGPNPEDLVSYCAEQPQKVGHLPFKVVSKRAQEHRGFGPWIGFKVADMIDRVLGLPVDFDQAAVFMFKDPEKAAMMLWEERAAPKYPANYRPKRDAILGQVTDYLIKEFENHNAPPFRDRPVNIQEVETVLCKWKSHMNGHYPLMNDIRDINGGLALWEERCDAARAFLHHMPKEK